VGGASASWQIYALCRMGSADCSKRGRGARVSTSVRWRTRVDEWAGMHDN
jgi:hypothetical protein